MAQERTSLNCCPYCGSDDIDIDVDTRIKCHLKDGQVVVNYDYADQVPEAVAGTDIYDMGGYCNYCGKYFNVADFCDKGILFETSPGVRREIDKKYSHKIYVINETNHQEEQHNIAAFLTEEEANAFFRHRIETRYWKPDTPWNGQYNNSIEEAVKQGEYTSEYDDMLSIDVFNC